jgi:hypothetical protein
MALGVASSSSLQRLTKTTQPTLRFGRGLLIMSDHRPSLTRTILVQMSVLYLGSHLVAMPMRWLSGGWS